MSEIVVHDLADLPFAAKQFLELIGKQKVVLFHAEMGAGKTTFINAVLRAMGIIETAGSPTYSIVNTYDSAYYGEVFHFDLYRLQSLDEALAIGIEEIIYSDSFCFIEWPKIIENILPENVVKVTISVSEIGDRILTID
jgi:tRNA threonylcarbamoyladenosine biosynthesis protein TsaE